MTRHKIVCAVSRNLPTIQLYSRTLVGDVTRLRDTDTRGRKTELEEPEEQEKEDEEEEKEEAAAAPRYFLRNNRLGVLSPLNVRWQLTNSRARRESRK